MFGFLKIKRCVQILIVSLILCMGLVACQKEEEGKKKEKDKGWCVMFYGSGSGGMDAIIGEMKQQIKDNVSGGQVKVVWLDKGSKEVQNDPDKRGTRLYHLEGGEFVLDSVMGYDYPLYEPRNIAASGMAAGCIPIEKWS